MAKPFTPPKFDFEAPRELMSAPQAAAFLSVSKGLLALWRRRGTGPTWSRLGGRRIVYTRSGLLAFVAAGLQKGA